MVIDGTEKKNSDDEITSQIITRVRVFTSDSDVRPTFGSAEGENSETIRTTTTDQYQFFGYATNTLDESQGPFATLSVLGLVKYDKECLKPWLIEQEDERNRIAELEAAEEAERLEREAKEKEEEDRKKREAELAANAVEEDEGSSTNGAVIFAIIFLVLLVIAGVLLFVFRKRLDLKDKCKKCCKKKSSVKKLSADPNDSARDPMKAPMRVTFKDETPDSNDVEKQKQKKKSDSETVEMAKNIQALKALQSYNEEEETKRVQAESPAVGSVLPAVASVKANEAQKI